MTFTVTRSGDAEADQTIDFATSIAGTDSAEATDFGSESGTLTFAAGVTTQTFTVQTVQDAIFEGGETFTATLSNNSAGSSITDATATGTILDDGTGPGPFDPTGPGTPDDDRPTVSSVSSPSANEGDVLDYTVILSNPSEFATTVNLDFDSGTGTYGIDTETPIEVSIGGGAFQTVVVNLDGTFSVDLPAGETGLVVRIPTFEDSKVEGDETIILNASTPQNNTPAQGTGTIINDDHAPTISSISAVTVSEEGLLGGLIDSTGDPVDNADDAFATGSINFTDADSSSFTLSLAESVSVTSNNNPISLKSNGDDVDNWNWDASSQTLTGSTSTGTDVLTITLDPVTSTGPNNNVSYTVNLLAPVDHPVNSTEDIMDLQFGVSIFDGANTASASFNVAIEDDRPVSGNLNSAIEVPLALSNVMLILDFSGSMRGQELIDMKTAVVSMLDSYDNAGYAAVQIVTFASSANIPGDGGWISVADAKAYITGLTDADMGGVTNYDAALAAAQTAFAETSGYIAGGKNISYFLSDGSPTSGSEIDTTTDQTNWETFVDNNNIDSFAVGFAGANVAALEPIAYDGSASPVAEERPAINATAAGTNLTDALLATVASVLPGNLFGSLATGGFGADGNGHVRTVTIDLVTYTYDANAGTITNEATGTVVTASSFSITTLSNGVMYIDMVTGAYSYQADPAFVTSFDEVVGYTMQDMDGDITDGTVTLNVSRESKPVPTLNANADDVYEADMAGGSNSSGNGEIASGNILSDDTIPSGLALTDVAISGGTTVVSGDIITITTAEGNTLTVDKVTGEYTYVLNNEIDHSAPINLVSENFDSGVSGWSNASSQGGSMLIQKDETVSKNFSNLGNNGDTVTVSFDMSIVGDWESGSQNYTDYFRVFVDGTEYEAVRADDYSTGGVTGYTYEIDVPVNSSGGALVSLEVNSTASDEQAVIDNFTITGPPQSGATVVDSFTYTVSDIGGAEYTSTLDVTIYDESVTAINGTAGNDDLDGGLGSDILIGGAGDDLLMGGLGTDFFDWNGGDEGTIATPASDHVQDFTVADDKLDLSDMLDSLGFTSSGGVVESYLSLTENATNEAVLSVKDSAGGSVVQEIVLDNVSIQDLKTDLSMDPGSTNNDLLNQLINDTKLIV